MKILFICGSQEPGKDGVGDYTRRLACKLIESGWEAEVIAINDKYVTSDWKGIQSDNNISIQVLRLASTSSWQSRFTYLKTCISTYKPQWISLQFVIFTFNKRGLPFGLARRLKLINGFGANWHIMFHELWIGTESTSMKLKLWAFLQKKIIKNLLSTLQPLLIHTHLPLYQKQIQHLGWQTKGLPLFSNITNLAVGNRDLLVRDAIKAVFFSQVEASTPVIVFLQRLQKEAEKNKLTYQIILSGGSTERMNAFFEQIKFLENEITSIKKVGFQSSEQLSNLLSDCTLGITPLPRHAVGKSSSVSVLIEHELPIAVPANFGNTPAFVNPGLENVLLFQPLITEINDVKIKMKDAKKLISLSTICHQFITDIKEALN